MESDKQFYEIIKIFPPLFFLLTKIGFNTKYELDSVTIKAISRSMDGLMKPLDSNEPYYIVEFENRKDKLKDIYLRTFQEMIYLQQENPENKYKAVLIFVKESQDPKTEPWYSYSQIPRDEFRVLYLEDLIKELALADPNHPMVAVFQPFLEREDKALAKKGKEYYDQIRNSSLPEEVREKFEKVFCNWLMIRFNKNSIKEINAMFNLFETPLEETVAYKEIAAIEFGKGKTEGRTEGITEGITEGGIKGGIKNLKQLFQKGYLPEEVFQAELAPLEKELEALEKQSE